MSFKLVSFFTFIVIISYACVSERWAIFVIFSFCVRRYFVQLFDIQTYSNMCSKFDSRVACVNIAKTDLSVGEIVVVIVVMSTRNDLNGEY